MKRTAIGVATAVVACLVLTIQLHSQIVRDVPQFKKISVFMRPKLEHHKDALEGILVRDYDKVAKHARKLGLLSLDSNWNVIQTREYLERSGEFQRTAETLETAAQKRNSDAAAFAFLQLTTQCLDCHKYVRDGDGRSKDGAPKIKFPPEPKTKERKAN